MENNEEYERSELGPPNHPFCSAAGANPETQVCTREKGIVFTGN